MSIKYVNQVSNGGGALSLLNKDNVTEITLNERYNTGKSSNLSTSLFRVF